MMNALSSKEMESTTTKEEADKITKDMRDTHQKEMRELEQDFQDSRKRLQTQIDQLTERNNELELSLKLQVNDLDNEIVSLKEQL